MANERNDKMDVCGPLVSLSVTALVADVCVSLIKIMLGVQEKLRLTEELGQLALLRAQIGDLQNANDALQSDRHRLQTDAERHQNERQASDAEIAQLKSQVRTEIFLLAQDLSVTNKWPDNSFNIGLFSFISH